MCGIAGLIHRGKSSNVGEELQNMLQALKHRGPDSTGYALYAKFNDLAIPGTTGILIAVSFFSGILLFTLGIMGIYIARIFEQARGREKYIIKEIKDFKFK